MLKKYTFQILLTISLFSIIGIFSCKEKNEDFPPKSWNLYFFDSDKITPRAISAILYENDHSRWLGSECEDGLIYNDGYGWKIFNKQNTGYDHLGVQCLLRTPNQLLWEGNRSGLLFYNGNEWKSLIENKVVTHLLTEGAGNLWIAFDDLTFPLAHYQNGNLGYFTKTDLPFTKVNGLCSDSSQTVWLATDSGIFTFKNKNFSGPIQLSNCSIEITSIVTAPNGTIWAADKEFHLIQINPKGINIFNTGTSSSLKNILPTYDGSIWCTTQSGELLCKKNTNWNIYTSESEKFPSAQLVHAFEGPKGYLLLSYSNGQVISFKY